MSDLQSDTYGDNMPEVDELSEEISFIPMAGNAMNNAASKSSELIDLDLDQMFKLCQDLLLDKELLRAVVSHHKKEVEYLNEVIQNKAKNG